LKKSALYPSTPLETFQAAILKNETTQKHTPHTPNHHKKKKQKKHNNHTPLNPYNVFEEEGFDKRIWRETSRGVVLTRSRVVGGLRTVSRTSGGFYFVRHGGG